MKTELEMRKSYIIYTFVHIYITIMYKASAPGINV